MTDTLSDADMPRPIIRPKPDRQSGGRSAIVASSLCRKRSKAEQSWATGTWELGKKKHIQKAYHGRVCKKPISATLQADDS